MRPSVSDLLLGLLEILIVGPLVVTLISVWLGLILYVWAANKRGD